MCYEKLVFIINLSVKLIAATPKGASFDIFFKKMDSQF